MYTSTFIFEAKPYDDEFHRFNDEIAARARVIPGFLGEEEWHNETTGLHAEIYYWETLEALHQLIGMPVHKEAKSVHERWIGPYRVVIAEVLTTYGQQGLGLEHVPPAAATA
ncbi:antibiotic biosynthesis monooxygenase family protein [Leifsonia shinshuensis]|uniref:Antibiotic biosynthesis monooxygenase n=1 Tax=Leifsonia shinshuensis TaxID=150026 RepID=A0A7G6Y8Q1_9MICO|nr:hypothetical protein [Leifsonia shinshuensis]QNE34866.1 hypothetical protein F1C12_06820 [Leifsonia shinshuensis]